MKARLSPWPPTIKTRRKIYSGFLLLVTAYAAFVLFTSDLESLLLTLLIPLIICGLLWVFPREQRASAEQEIAPDASGPASMPVKKRIILFSDGTGNSSSQLFKTNVWRLYQVIDFGDIASGNVVQIGSYNDGVGNSTFKPLAILGGIFGLGLRRNVIQLYRFLCRNYKIGDEIYVFGFSRGAFTVRILTALIAQQGVLTDYRDERHLNSLSNAAYRRFVRKNVPSSFPGITLVARFLRDMFVRFYAWLLDPQQRDVATYMADIEFVGVWDTVGAYGGPIIEITRGIDRWVAPLSMTDYMLSGRVKAARHALALDDERASFRPLVWDEVHEAEKRIYRGKLKELLEKGDLTDSERIDAETKLEKVKNFTVDRMKQVWFSGMHADVGGGYPDESLSYVSLLWMIDELGDRLQFLPIEVERLRRAANICGPIHNSRKGLGAYYRYQPRLISAFMHHGGAVDAIGQTLSHRDPAVTVKRTAGKSGAQYRGLLTHCRVHSSVLLRIAVGTDNYAPIGLPETFVIDDDVNSLSGKDRDSWNSITANLQLKGSSSDRAARQEDVWDWVIRRRVVYFTTLIFTLAFLAMPVWSSYIFSSDTVSDQRWVGGIAANLLMPVLPDAAEYWLNEFKRNPVWFLILVIAIVCFLILGSFMERLLRDSALSHWKAALTEAPRGLQMVDRFRHKFSYQRTLQMVKWSIIPNILGMIAVVSIIYLVSIVGVQSWMLFAERNGSLCAIENSEYGDDIPNYSLTKSCNDMRKYVEAKNSYKLTFTAKGQDPFSRCLALKGVGIWSSSCDVDTAKNREIEFAEQTDIIVDRSALLFASPFRRVVPAKWLQPIYMIRNYSDQSPPEKRPRGKSEKIGHDISLHLISYEVTSYQDRSEAKAIIKPPHDGRLFMFANDIGTPGAACKYVQSEICDVSINVEIEELD